MRPGCMGEQCSEAKRPAPLTFLFEKREVIF
jgi:hypothetical protein